MPDQMITNTQIEDAPADVLEVSPSDASLLFVLAAKPTQESFDDLIRYFSAPLARDVARVLVGQAPAETEAVERDSAEQLARLFRERTKAAPARLRAAAAG